MPCDVLLGPFHRTERKYRLVATVEVDWRKDTAFAPQEGLLGNKTRRAFMATICQTTFRGEPMLEAQGIQLRLRNVYSMLCQVHPDGQL